MFFGVSMSMLLAIFRSFEIVYDGLPSNTRSIGYSWFDRFSYLFVILMLLSIWNWFLAL